MTGTSATPARPRVVCVDDDATIRRFVAMALEDLPVEVISCADAAAARASLAQGPVALLITDLMMPGESGFELLESLRADPALRGTARLAVFSAGLNAATRARLEGLDVWRELDKPVSLAALERCVLEATGLAEPARAPVATMATEDPARPEGLEGLDAEVRAAVRLAFGGDLALYQAFRTEARAQFAHDRSAGDRALAAADWPGLRLLAHSLKSVFELLGDARAAAAARALELAAANGEASVCRTLWPCLRQALV